MRLTSCRECTGQVSTDATACPHCGAPVVPKPAGPSLMDAGRKAKWEFPAGPVFGALLLLAGMMLAGRQAWLWLRTGVWPTFSILDLIVATTSNEKTLEWAAAPTDWMGLHRMLAAAPVSVLALILGAVIFFSSIAGPADDDDEYTD